MSQRLYRFVSDRTGPPTDAVPGTPGSSFPP